MVVPFFYLTNLITFVKQSLVPVVFGIGIGLVLALLGHLVSSQFWVYELQAHNLAFVLALPLMGIIATLACYWPVKTVIKADPIKALRNE